MESDEDILALVRANDKNGALRLMLQRHSAAVWTHCKRVLRDEALAQDVHQQVFIEAHRDCDRMRGTGSVRGWLFGIAGHRCLDAIKARRRRDARYRDDAEVTEVPETGPLPTEQLDAARRNQALEGCLDNLADEVRSTVLMRFRGGMSYAEIGAAVDMKESALQMRVTRALSALRVCLERKGVEP